MSLVHTFVSQLKQSKTQYGFNTEAFLHDHVLFTEDTEIPASTIPPYLKKLATLGLTPSKELFSSKYIQPNGSFYPNAQSFIKEIVTYTASLMKLFMYLLYTPTSVQTSNKKIKSPETKTAKTFLFNFATNSFAWENKILNKNPNVINEKQYQDILEYASKYRNLYPSLTSITYRLNSLARAMIMLFREDIQIYIYNSELNSSLNIFAYKHPNEVLKFIIYDKPITDISGDYISKSIINSFVGYQSSRSLEPHYHTWHSTVTDIIRLTNFAALAKSKTTSPTSSHIIKIDKNTKPIQNTYIQSQKQKYLLSGSTLALLDAFMHIDSLFPNQPNEKISYITLLLKELAQREKTLPSKSEYLKKIFKSISQIPLDKSIVKYTSFEELINLILNAIKSSPDAMNLFNSIIKRIFSNQNTYDQFTASYPSDETESPSTNDKKISLFTLPNVKDIITKHVKPSTTNPSTNTDTDDNTKDDINTDTDSDSDTIIVDSPEVVSDDDTITDSPTSSTNPTPTRKRKQSPSLPVHMKRLSDKLRKFPPGYQL